MRGCDVEAGSVLDSYWLILDFFPDFGWLHFKFSSYIRSCMAELRNLLYVSERSRLRCTHKWWTQPGLKGP